MIGAVAGDIIGSVYEWDNIKTTFFDLFSQKCAFTDDSVLTIALAESILDGVDYTDNLKRYYRLYPDAGYGGRFKKWAESDETTPYYSWGNGSAMRISPVGFAYDDLETVLTKAREFTEITHNHPEGIKGAQATAAAIFMARSGRDKDEIKDYIEQTFDYYLGMDSVEIRREYRFDPSARGTVPQAIRAFYDSRDFEDAIRIAVSFGGDSDTLACITGGIAQAYYEKIPQLIIDKVYSILDEPLAEITRRFTQRFCQPRPVTYNFIFD